MKPCGDGEWLARWRLADRRAWTGLGLAAFALAASAGVANGAPKDEAAQSWLMGLKDQWLIIDSSEIQVSHPYAEMLCSDGRWLLPGQHQQTSGTYTLTDRRLCVTGGSVQTMCRVLSRARDGRLTACSNGGAQNIMQIRPVSAVAESANWGLGASCRSN